MLVGLHWPTRDHMIPYHLFWALYMQIPAIASERRLENYDSSLMAASVAQNGDPSGVARRTIKSWRDTAYPELLS